MGVLLGFRPQFGGRNDGIEQAHGQSLLGGHAIGTEQEFHGRRIRHLAWEPDRRPATGEQPPLGFHDTEVGLGHRHPQVAPPEHLHATGHAGAVHGGDDGLVEFDAAQHGPDPVVDPVAVEFLELPTGDVLLQFRDLGDVRLQVRPHAEGVADTGDDRHP